MDTDYTAHSHGIKVLLNKMEVFLFAFYKKKKMKIHRFTFKITVCYALILITHRESITSRVKPTLEKILLNSAWVDTFVSWVLWTFREFMRNSLHQQAELWYQPMVCTGSQWEPRHSPWGALLRSEPGEVHRTGQVSLPLFFFLIEMIDTENSM